MIPLNKPTRILSLSLILALLVLSRTKAAPEYVYHVCSNATTFARNSTYESNQKLLFSALSSNATIQTGFYNATVGQNPNKVYGLFQCRGDITPAACQECVSTATDYTLTPTICPVEKVAIIWYDQCILRYSNQSFFSVVSLMPTVSLLNTQSIESDMRRFNQLVLATLSDTAALAANSSSTGDKNFATKEADFTANQTLYTLAQCTEDLSSGNCRTCLQEAVQKIPSCCTGKRGGRVLYPSCYVRYEVYQFYGNLTVSPEPSPVVPLPPASGNGGISTAKIIAIVVPVSIISLLLFIMGYCFITRRAKKRYAPVKEDSVVNEITNAESLQLDFSTIEDSTNKFSEDNKLGEGGFGEVYKGRLRNGQEIAVKRLSKHSVQGSEEFKNEVVLVAKLQHRNLVRLLGFCLQGEERILVYEYVVNKSLDSFLYDPERQRLLDWSRRYKIIGGIARGILYLHEDSRLKIIHRDLKASNILLDQDLNPKISDFGMARIVRVDQTQGNTSRIVGTYGYMSPEYAMHGMFSVKSDVYAFGVLVLEIISGKKNSNFYLSEYAEDLLSYAWKLWKEGTPLELLDPSLRDSYSRNEVLRCIHIGLLCVQEDPADRPTMASIVLMLNSYSVTLPVPQQPAFFIGSKDHGAIPRKNEKSDQSTSKSIQWSLNEASITELHPR